MISLPKGFKCAVANADFRGKKLQRNDLGIIISDLPAVTAGVFTTNLFKAAPVVISQKNLSEAKEIRGIVVNSGQANACTGEQGMQNCLYSLELVSGMLEEIGVKVSPHSLLPASTGVIGAQMDMEKWSAAMPQLSASFGKCDPEAVERAIMTTDAFPKMESSELSLKGGTVTLAGIAKGAGMICPNMATMISIVLCDAKIDNPQWEDMFRRAVDKTFNRVSVDGDTSTNDSLYGMANGASGVRPKPEEIPLLEKALTDILAGLSYLLVKDGEGATKVMHIKVTGAESDEEAEKVARAVGHSQLVKTAMFGKDPNWGRIVAAAGRSGAKFDPMELRLILCGVEIFKNGCPADIDVDAVFKEPLELQDIPMEIILGKGSGSSTILASDLSHAYVTLNSDYRS